MVDKVDKHTGSSPKFILRVRGVGAYAEDNIIKLMWTVIKHRFYHLVTEGKWRD
jgi:hypothetical protein